MLRSFVGNLSIFHATCRKIQIILYYPPPADMYDPALSIVYSVLSNTSISVIYDLFIKYQGATSQTPRCMIPYKWIR